MQHIFEIPFSVSGTTVSKGNNWDLKYTDGADVAYKFHIDESTTIYATTANSATTIQRSKIEIFDINKNSVSYKYIGGPSSSNVLTANLTAGDYYIVVDGYDEGSFELTVSNTTLKSAQIEESEFNETSPNLISGKDILIYPNPARNNANIIFPNEEQYLINIINIKGEIIKTNSFKGKEFLIDCSNYSHGLYIVQIISAKESYNKRLIISK